MKLEQAIEILKEYIEDDKNNKLFLPKDLTLSIERVLSEFEKIEVTKFNYITFN